MKKINPKWISKTIEQARKRWGIEDWEITWEFGTLQVAAEIDVRFWTERRAMITVSDQLDVNDPMTFRRILYHELGHLVVANIWRGVSDFADVYIKSKKARALFEESTNTRENETIDHIVVQVMKIR